MKYDPAVLKSRFTEIQHTDDLQRWAPPALPDSYLGRELNELRSKLAGALAMSLRDLEYKPYHDMTEDEIKLDVLKAAVMDPELYNTIRQLMVDHPYPDRLDPQAKRLRKIFMELDHGTN